MPSKSRRITIGLIATVIIVVTGSRIATQFSAWRSEAVAQAMPAPEYAVPRTAQFQPQVVIPKRFVPITEFSTRLGREVNDQMNPAELVVGVAMDGVAKAYPINMLTGPRREIINDRVGETALATTW